MSLLTDTERRRKTLLRRLAAIVAVVVVAAAVGVGLLTGLPNGETDDGARNGPTAAPESSGAARDQDGGAVEDAGIWTVPPVSAGPLIAPPPAGRERGVPTGFPHTTEGAISAAARYAETAIGLDEQQARAVGEIATAPSYMSAADEFALGVTSARKSLGLAPDEDLGGAYLRYQAEAYRVVDATPDRVIVQILGLVNGAGPATSGQGRTSVSVVSYVLVWVDGDWLLAGPSDADEPDPPPSTGTSQAYEGGWRDLAIA